MQRMQRMAAKKWVWRAYACDVGSAQQENFGRTKVTLSPLLPMVPLLPLLRVFE